MRTQQQMAERDSGPRSALVTDGEVRRQPSILRRRSLLLAVCLCLVMFAIVAAVQGDKSKAASEADWSLLLPDDPGKAELVLACSNCHGLKQVIPLKKSKSGWQTTVRKMTTLYHVPVDAEDMPTILGYLAKHFGDSNPIEALPINLNTAAAAALERLPGITPTDAKAIVESRESKGPFTDVADLQRVRSIKTETVTRIKLFATTKD